MRAGRAALLLTIIVASNAAAATVAEAVHAAASTRPFDSAIWFVLVEDDDGSVIYERNARKLAIPASVRKIFTATAVAECLPFDQRLETQMWIDGEDVVLLGQGDPSFGSDRFGYEPETVAFEPFVRALRERRISSIRDIVVDVSMFDRVTLPYQWKLGNITSDVAAPVDAIAWSENDIGRHAVASAGHFAGLAFRDVLHANGIAVTGTVRVEIEPRSWQELVASVESPFVYDLLATILKPSHNLFAETLFKAISAGDGPASYEGARERERLFLTETVGLDATSFRFVDGSGLAPDDLVTPAAVVAMLRWMNHPHRRADWWNLLAAPGAPEGTLRRRLTPLVDRLRGKTGTVAGVNALAGIIAGRNGGYRYFAVFVNHHLGASSAATALIDAIVEAAADF